MQSSPGDSACLPAESNRTTHSVRKTGGRKISQSQPYIPLPPCSLALPPLPHRQNQLYTLGIPSIHHSTGPLAEITIRAPLYLPDHINIRISHSGPMAQYTGDTRNHDLRVPHVHVVFWAPILCQHRFPSPGRRRRRRTKRKPPRLMWRAEAASSFDPSSSGPYGTIAIWGFQK